MDYHHYTRKCDRMCDSCDFPESVRLPEWWPMETAPKDGTVIQLLMHHRNRQYAKGPEKREWEQIVEATWIDFNGGGWTWHGMCGEPQGWRPMPSNGEVRGASRPAGEASASTVVLAGTPGGKE